MQKIIKTGEWKYSGNTYLPILLVEQDWEHFYGKNNSRFSAAEKRDMVYFLHFGKYQINEQGQISSHSSSEPFFSLDDAMDYATRNIEILKWSIDKK